MEGNLSMLHVKRILEIPLLNFYLMKVVLITSIMNISLLKRKRLFHGQVIPNHLTVVVQVLRLLNPTVVLKGLLISIRTIKPLPLLYMQPLRIQEFKQHQQEDMVMIYKYFLLAFHGKCIQLLLSVFLPTFSVGAVLN